MSGLDTLARFRTAVAEDLAWLADLHDRELDRARLLRLWEVCFDAELLGFTPPGEQLVEARSLFRQGLTDIPVATDPQTLDLLAAEYADIYLNYSLRASPCESVWIDEDGLVMQEPMFQVREWYRRHGLAVADWRTRPDDHLVCQLMFLSHLFQSAGERDRLEEAARFLDDHPLRWISAFAERVAGRCRTRLYAGLALLTAAYLDGIRDTLAEILGQPRPTAEEVELRMRPPRSAVTATPISAYVPGAAPGWQGDAQRPAAPWRRRGASPGGKSRAVCAQPLGDRFLPRLCRCLPQSGLEPDRRRRSASIRLPVTAAVFVRQPVPRVP